MKQAKRHKLLDAGYRVTDTKEFLGLSDSEAAIIEAKIALVQRLHEVWGANGTDTAKMKAGFSETTLDLIKTLFALGVTSKELEKTIEQAAYIASADRLEDALSC